jgi:hypothetical protein
MGGKKARAISDRCLLMGDPYPAYAEGRKLELKEYV